MICLLELVGSDVRLLFEGLLSRQVIRDPLETVYGIDKATVELMRAAPFRLRLRPQPRGPFQASLEMQVATGTKRPQWERLLGRLAEVLVDRDLQGSPRQPPAPSKGSSPAELPDASQPQHPRSCQSVNPQERQAWIKQATWTRQDGVVVGGWRWITPARGNPELLFFLGPVPTIPLPIERGTEPELLLRARPTALERLGCCPRPCRPW